MKHPFFRIGILASFFLLFSCNKQEVFSPNRYIETESYQSGSASLEVIKRFSYTQNNQLSSLWLKEGNTTLTFEYNKDKTIKKITSSENNGANYALLSYADKRLTQIQYYENNQLARESQFSRKDKKNTINKIENYVHEGFAPETKSVLAEMLFADAKNMPQSVLKSQKSGGKQLYSVLNVTYEKDNIQRVRLSYIIDGKEVLYSTYTYSYDEMKNPYYGLPYALFELTGYSKNNVKSVTFPIENDPLKTMFTINSTYSYEIKYPVDMSVVEIKTYIVGYETVIVGNDTVVKPIYTTDSKYSSYQYNYK